MNSLFDNLNGGIIGTISELMVVIDLLKKNYQVYKAVAPTNPGDIVVFKNDTYYAIEIKTGYISPSGSIRYAGKIHTDYLALITPKTNKILYFIKQDDQWNLIKF